MLGSFSWPPWWSCWMKNNAQRSDTPHRWAAQMSWGAAGARHWESAQQCWDRTLSADSLQARTTYWWHSAEPTLLQANSKVSALKSKPAVWISCAASTQTREAATAFCFHAGCSLPCLSALSVGTHAVLSDCAPPLPWHARVALLQDGGPPTLQPTGSERHRGKGKQTNKQTIFVSDTAPSQNRSHLRWKRTQIIFWFLNGEDL